MDQANRVVVVCRGELGEGRKGKEWNAFGAPVPNVRVLADSMHELAAELIKKHLWRRLPISLRQAAGRIYRGHFTPRITPTAKPEPPIIVTGLFTQASGLGAAARACHDALKSAGLPVYGIDLTGPLQQTPNFPNFSYVEGRSVIGKGTLFLHLGGPLVPWALVHLGRSFIRNKRVIGHWFWEMPVLPQDWRPATAFVHDIFVNTKFVADAVRSLPQSPPVHIVAYPLPVNSRPLTVSQVSRQQPFTVLFAFNVLSNFSRKNPCAVIEAFRLAFGSDPGTRLVIKFVNAQHWPESLRLLQTACQNAPNIELIGDILGFEAMEELYRRADVVISLHRAEGLGLLIAEAMLRGIPVVATDWSATTDFVTSATGIPIGYELIPVNDPQLNYTGDIFWADPKIEEAAAALQTLRADLEVRRRLGRAGAVHAAQHFDTTRYVEYIKHSTNGERLSQLAHIDPVD
jgi:glycosyltransferase involved in cell wall biosynthesis